MARVRDVAAYFCVKYPHKRELSKTRLTKMVYLADWRSAIVRGRQITEINWFFNYYGPFVDDVIEAIRSDPEFSIVQTTNYLGGRKELVEVISSNASWSSLDAGDIEILDYVIDQTAHLYWNDFIKLVYSTYPIVTQERMESLDLVALAKEYAGSDIRAMSA